MVETADLSEQDAKASRPRALIAVAVSVPLVLLVIALCLTFVAPNHICITVDEIPAKTYYWSFVSKRRGHVSNVNWLVANPLGYSKMEPADCTISYRPNNADSKIWRILLEVSQIDELGVLVLSESSEWKISWINCSELDPRPSFWGSRRATMSIGLKNRKFERADDALVRELDLNHIRVK